MNKQVDIGWRIGVLEEEGPVQDGDKQGEGVEDEDEDRGYYQCVEVSWVLTKY